MIGLSAPSPSPPPAFSRSASPTAALLRRASPALVLVPGTLARSHPWNRVRCRSSGGGGGAAPGPGSSENESKAVLDAFFLGKAFAEALNERIESTVGELLSVVGRWQAEQQKQVQDFQEEVIKRAKKAKERAALEVVDEKGAISKSLGDSSKSATRSVSPPSSGPTAEEPLQQALKD
uniref:Uncharacterized protein n=1 Tax=Ananas comosus var. bracteatus TaxID=296719 RepID=A0A6V7QKP3_ANACO|nr:unnamed protein product [Ananas comosus var. bracteatus]